MSATFDQTQTVFTLSMFSNLGADLTGSVEFIEQKLAERISTALTLSAFAIGKWEIIWGPAVYQSQLFHSNRADNVMYVARKASGRADSNEIVVAIAGTNPSSSFDWLLEDFFVNEQVAWPYGMPPSHLHPKLAAGTAMGLSILQNVRPGPKLPGAGMIFLDAIREEISGKRKMTITGHSLGGALSPVVALWLADTQFQWDPSGYVRIFCLPSAGPTPGNFDFASYYTGSLVGTRTNRVHNLLDVIPHAWAQDDLEQIPFLYEPFIPFDLEVEELVLVAIADSFFGRYAQINPTAVGLRGTMNQDIISSGKKTFANFVTQMVYQHVDAYFKLLLVSEVLNILAPSFALLGHALAEGIISTLRARIERKKLMLRERERGWQMLRP
jgi:Lipase (class 3)